VTRKHVPLSLGAGGRPLGGSNTARSERSACGKVSSHGWRQIQVQDRPIDHAGIANAL